MINLIGKKQKGRNKKIDIDEAEETIKDINTESDVEEPVEPENVFDIMLDNKKKKK